MAERMDYHERAGLRAVERFMKHHFLVARDVGELTRIICSALELKQLKQPPVLYRLFDKLRPAKAEPDFENEDFSIEHGRMNVKSEHCFERDPLEYYPPVFPGGIEQCFTASSGPAPVTKKLPFDQ